MDHHDIRSSGLSMLEVIFTLAILMMITPFMYRQMIRHTHQLQALSMAKNFKQLEEAATNYVRINEVSWGDGYEETISGVALLDRMENYGLKRPFQTYPQFFTRFYFTVIKKIDSSGNEDTNAYVIILHHPSFSALRAWQIINFLGATAGYADDGIVEGFQNAWRLTNWDYEDKAIVLRINWANPKEQPKNYLHTTDVAGDPVYNTMEKNLYLGAGITFYDVRNAYNINPLEENELRSGKIEADEDFKVNYLHIEPVADSEVGDDKSSSDSDTPLLVAEEGYFYNALRVGQADNDDSSFTVAGDVTVNYKIFLHSDYTVGSLSAVSSGSGRLSGDTVQLTLTNGVDAGYWISNLKVLDSASGFEHLDEFLIKDSLKFNSQQVPVFQNIEITGEIYVEQGMVFSDLGLDTAIKTVSGSPYPPKIQANKIILENVSDTSVLDYISGLCNQLDEENGCN